jgi:integrase
MGYKLLPPGARRNNATYIVRGTVGGRRFEARTDATTREAAERWAIRFVAGLESAAPAGPVLTFAQAAEAYIALKRPRRDDERHIRLLGRWFAGKPLGEIVGADLVAAAHALKPTVGDATKNRAIITPGSAVLHYAEEQGWCPYRRHRRLKVSRRSPRRPASDETLRLLLANTEGHRHLLLAWLYETGLRISDSLRLHDDDLALARNRARVGSRKTDDHGEIELSPELVALLANSPRCAGGRVFPWRDRHGVYRWLRPLCRRLGVAYTPHLSRHALATDLRALGWDMRAIAERGIWRDERSAGRYTHHRATATPGRSVGILRRG